MVTHRAFVCNVQLDCICDQASDRTYTKIAHLFLSASSNLKGRIVKGFPSMSIARIWSYFQLWAPSPDMATVTGYLLKTQKVYNSKLFSCIKSSNNSGLQKWRKKIFRFYGRRGHSPFKILTPSNLRCSKAHSTILKCFFSLKKWCIISACYFLIVTWWVELLMMVIRWWSISFHIYFVI